MLGIQRFAFTLLLSVGPLRVACHATVKPSCEGHDGRAETCSAEEAKEPREEPHSRTTRPPAMRHVSHPHDCANESSCETTTSAPG